MTESVIVRSAGTRALETGVAKDHFLTEHWYQRDLEAVFRPRWHYAAHVSELSHPGAFVLFSLDDEEVIICRDNDMQLSAFYNFCTHRGHRLCTEDRGTIARNIICPYHGWAFKKEDGACIGAPRMNKEFDRSDYGLKTAWIEEFHGMVFVSVAEKKPASVADQTRHLTAASNGLGGYDLSRMKVAARLHLEFEANWKLLRENDDECYHCVMNHPELIEGYDPWHGFTVVEDLDNPQHLWTHDEWALLELGNTYAAKQVCKIPAPRFDGNEGFDNQDIQFFWQPSGHIVVQRDHTWMWLIKPLGPQRTLLTQVWLVAEEAIEGQDYDFDTLTQLFNVTMQQDKQLCEQVQRGLRMRHYTPGPLNPHHQSPAAAFYRWYLRCLSESR